MKTETRKLARIGLMIVVVWLIINYWVSGVKLVTNILGAALPLLLGGVIAYIVNIVMSGYERILLPRCQKKAWVKARRPVCLAVFYFPC